MSLRSRVAKLERASPATPALNLTKLSDEELERLEDLIRRIEDGGTPDDSDDEFVQSLARQYLTAAELEALTPPGFCFFTPEES